MASSSSNKIALLTGGTGFIGSNLARRLISGRWEVHMIVRPNTRLDLVRDIVEKLSFHEYDGTTECLINILAVVKPDMVFHLASFFLAQHESNHVDALIESNVLFGTQLVEAMATQGIHCLVNTGTSWQHYEGREVSPVNLYAATKQAFEAILQFYVESRDIKVITLKLFDTYGPHDPRPKLIPMLASSIAANKPIDLSPGNQLVDMVYIDDVIEAYWVASERLWQGASIGHETYAVSSGNPVELRKLVEMFCLEGGANLPINWGGRPYRHREVMVPWSAGKPLPGWQPKTELRCGIKKIVESAGLAEYLP